MAARGGRLRVQRIALGPLGELEALAARVHAEPHAFALSADARGSATRIDWGVAWLDSGRAATAGRSVLAVGRAVELRRGSVLIDARAALDALRARTDEQLPSPLGLIGWFGYELRDETMGAPVPSVPDAHRASWMLVDSALVVDHATGLAELVAVGEDDDVADWVARMRAAIDAVELAAGDDARDERRGATAEAAEPARTAGTAGLARWRDTDAHYAELVRQCLAAIRDGDAYQLCLTTQATVETSDDPVTLYRRVRASSPAHHGALITLGGVSLVSASPETFLTVRDGVVTTRPIKGTRRRDPDSERDAALARELAADEKERAENLMIVDLMRNDLQRVCAIGSVTVTGLHEVESYRHVHQLVSTVSGRLRPGLDALDAVEATFPAGSMT
ncbi:MAG TPA: anthranilate synthase component I family protein, partial [Microcella sp.]|nr:anthranilate synthase component I family protein [Microcella sp.]